MGVLGLLKEPCGAQVLDLIQLLDQRWIVLVILLQLHRGLSDALTMGSKLGNATVTCGLNG